MHLAPKLLGAGPSLVGDLGISTIADALSLAIVDVTPLGGDVQIRLRPTRHTGGSSPRTEGVEVFTGIVEEVGTLVVREDQSRLRPCCGSAPTGCCEDVALGDSIAVNGVCLTVTAVDGRRLEHRRHGRDAAAAAAWARSSAGDAGQPRARGHPAHPPRRPHDAGPRRRRRHDRRPARPASTGRSCGSRLPAGPRPLRRREGLDRRRRRLAHRQRGQRRRRRPSPGSRSASSPPPSARPRSVRAPRGSPSTWRST